MSVDVPVLHERARGCGHRKGGGLYLVSDGIGEPCPKLPIELTVCPVCRAGIKPTRGWTWVEPNALVSPAPHGPDRHSIACPLSHPGGLGERCGLLWIGGQFYSPESFAREAESMGVSRRLAAIPRDPADNRLITALPELPWVLVAHREAVPLYEQRKETTGEERTVRVTDDDGAPMNGPGIFHVFKPTRVEYVVTGQESEEELEGLVRHGAQPVRVVPIEDDNDLEEAA